LEKRLERIDALIVGCGIAGITMAERLADAGWRCHLVDRRPHIGGNCHDCLDVHGVLIHPYGPHYFRTNSPRVVEYLSRFTEWQPAEYRVLSRIGDRHYQFPINLNTFEQILGRPSSEEEMKATLEEWREPIENPKNSEEVIVSQVGWKLYEMFFKNYTLKQWNHHPRDLDASVCGRIPIRTNRDDRYLAEEFQALPKAGYTAMFERMLASPRISVETGVDFAKARNRFQYRKLIYTGPIDAYFDFKLGRLPYRSLRFETEHHEIDQYQPAMQVNYPNEEAFTRIVEIKQATGQQVAGTTIVKEYPQDFTEGSEPFYPVPMAESRSLYEQYRELAELEADTVFLGRLATYRYYNMDQVVGMALAKSGQLLQESNA
jgi:UDP-galactopyranose mutase